MLRTAAIQKMKHRKLASVLLGRLEGRIARERAVVEQNQSSTAVRSNDPITALSGACRKTSPPSDLGQRVRPLRYHTEQVLLYNLRGLRLVEVTNLTVASSYSARIPTGSVVIATGGIRGVNHAVKQLEC